MLSTDLANLIDDEFEKAIECIGSLQRPDCDQWYWQKCHHCPKNCATLNSTGTPSIFLHAADAIHGDLGMVQQEDVVMIISKSGESPEIKVLVP